MRRLGWLGAVAAVERVTYNLADEPVPLKTVVDLVGVDNINPAQVYTPPLARVLVHATMRREYSCTVNKTK